MYNMHHFGKMDFDLEALGVMSGQAFEWQKRSDRFCRDRLLPAVENLFDRLSGPDEVLRIERLHIQLEHFSQNGHWEDSVLAGILEALEAQIKAHLQDKGPETPVAQTLSRPAAFFEQWLYFLQHGSLPAGTGRPPEQTLLAAVLEEVAANARAQQKLIAVLQKSAAAFRRLTEQHTPAYLDQLLTACYGNAGTQWIALRVQTIHYANTIVEWIARENLFEFIKNLKLNYIKNIDFKIFINYEIDIIQQNQDEFTARALYHILSAQIPREKQADFWSQLKVVLSAVERPIVPHQIAHHLWQISILGAADPPPRRPDLEMVSSVEGPSFSTPHAEPPQETEKEAVFIPAKDVVERPSVSKTKDGAPKPLEIEEKRPMRENAEQNYWYLNDAGLILLHPFLSTFFKHLNLTGAESSDFKDFPSQQQAVYALHYLARAVFDAPEYELVFPKLLCGLEPESPLERYSGIEMPETLPEEAENLLNNVIRYWDKLGAASTTALRESFLQRPGKLIRRADESWQLQLETNGIDVLLNYLPWGIGTVKLPWMKGLLHTEWNYDRI
jgi:Contractile injection system tape measure protein